MCKRKRSEQDLGLWASLHQRVLQVPAKPTLTGCSRRSLWPQWPSSGRKLTHHNKKLQQQPAAAVAALHMKCGSTEEDRFMQPPIQSLLPALQQDLQLMQSFQHHHLRQQPFSNHVQQTIAQHSLADADEAAAHRHSKPALQPHAYEPTAQMLPQQVQAVVQLIRSCLRSKNADLQQQLLYLLQNGLAWVLPPVLGAVQGQGCQLPVRNPALPATATADAPRWPVAAELPAAQPEAGSMQEAVQIEMASFAHRAQLQLDALSSHRTAGSSSSGAKAHAARAASCTAAKHSSWPRRSGPVLRPVSSGQPTQEPATRGACCSHQAAQPAACQTPEAKAGPRSLVGSMRHRHQHRLAALPQSPAKPSSQLPSPACQLSLAHPSAAAQLLPRPLQRLAGQLGCARAKPWSRAAPHHRTRHQHALQPSGAAPAVRALPRSKRQPWWGPSRQRALSGQPHLSQLHAAWKASKLRMQRFIVRRSGIAERGVFTAEFVEAGEVLMEYAGEVIRRPLADRREAAYMRQGLGLYMFRLDKDCVVDATKRGNLARFINHSCSPNCVAKILTVESQKRIFIFAKQEVAPGEELTYDYCLSPPTEEAGEAVAGIASRNGPISCLCNSSSCKGYL